MLTSEELLASIEALEDKGIDLSFEIVRLDINHNARPDIPITIYIGGNLEYREEMMEEFH